jgi:hypothetical protein
MQRRAESLSQRAADLKKVADAWEPLYKTLSDDRKSGFRHSRGSARNTRKTTKNESGSTADCACANPPLLCC